MVEKPIRQRYVEQVDQVCRAIARAEEAIAARDALAVELHDGEGLSWRELAELAHLHHEQLHRSVLRTQGGGTRGEVRVALEARRSAQ